MNIFSICHWYQRRRWCTLSCELSSRSFEKIQNGPEGSLMGLIHGEKKIEVENPVTLSIGYSIARLKFGILYLG
jgi:hypothetical protein